jgi:hypothetical protein
MMHSKNKISGEATTLSSVVREYIVRHCVTLTAHMPAQFLKLSKDGQAQTRSAFAEAAVDKTKTNARSLNGRNKSKKKSFVQGRSKQNPTYAKAAMDKNKKS